MSLKTRLSKLEGPGLTLPPVDVSIHTFFVRGEDGPEETGEALAGFAGASLPMLKKSLLETKKDFDARVAVSRFNRATTRRSRDLCREP